MVADTPRRALIVGAGPGGLTAAIALHRVGIEAALFERAPQLGKVGAGIGVQSNAMRALMRLGIGDRLMEAGTEVREQQICDQQGNVLLRLPQGEVADAFGTPTISLLRADVQLALVDALPEGVLRLGSECTAVEQDANGVTAHFADGGSERGAILIGADGGRSVVRKHVFGNADTKPRYSGVTITRSAVRLDGALPQDTAKLCLGYGQTFVMFPVGKERIYWGIGKRESEGGKLPSEGLHRALTDQLGDFLPLAREIVEATPEEQVIKTDIYDRNPDKTWIKGRVVLLGDAAHLTTPFVGQGAGISMEDSVRLAKELALTDGLRDERMLDQALKAYENERLPRCSKVVLSSRRRGQVLFWRQRALVAGRNAVFRSLPANVRRSLLASSLDYEV